MFSLQISRRYYFCSAFTLPLLLSCSSTGSNDQGDDVGTGGHVASGGGTSETGGNSGTGGDTATGGGLGTGGGDLGTGGALGTGGDTATGGDSGTGGDTATGGDSGTGGEAPVCPGLEAELLEGVGDFERPGPYNYGSYADTPASGVPRGTLEDFDFDEDEFYPGHPRTIRVYEPAQFEEGQEAFLSVFFDGTASWAYLGNSYRTQNVLDNLINEGLIPPFIAVFIGNEGDGGNRQDELQPVDDKQARFIQEAVLPAVSERYGYTFSEDPKKRSITGESSGGNAAFTVAWQHPEWFHRMQGHSSSFDFGPAHNYPDIIRDADEVKPLRIHLEGSINGNPAVAEALAEKGYVYQWFNSIDSGHGGPGGDTSFPEGLIWLWKGWDCL